MKKLVLALFIVACGSTPDGKQLSWVAPKDGVMTDSRGRDTAALYAVDVATKRKTLIAEDPKADLGETITHPKTFAPQAVAFPYAPLTRQELAASSVQIKEGKAGIPGLPNE